jgi:hypothetical protein
MPLTLEADEKLVRSVLFYETRVLHSLVCDDPDRTELRQQAARVLEACVAYELGDYDGAIEALKDES